MAEPSSLSPDWPAAAAAASSALGFGPDLATLSEERWDRVCREVERSMGPGASPPEGWEAALARQVGRVDPHELARDEADARLAAEGEVFSTDDDA